MDSAYLSALSALAGSVVGGLTTGLTSWLNQREQAALFAMVSRMRVLCSPQIVVSAENVMRATSEAYDAPNKTIPQLNKMMKSETGIDPLKDFANAARDELQTFPRHRATSALTS